MRSERGTHEYDALQDALTTYAPPCQDDQRYTADNLDGATLAELTAGCDLCHASVLCDAYARKAKPAAGIWAGRYYRNTPRGGDS